MLRAMRSLEQRRAAQHAHLAAGGLEADLHAHRAGLPIASACGAGGLCGRCGLEILEGADALGAESESEQRSKRRNRVDPAERLACRVILSADARVRASYW